MVVLDTHAWIWWVSDPERLSSGARAAIEAAGSIGIATISCWEAVMLSLRGRIALDRSPAAWVRAALGQSGVAPLAIGPRVAVAAALLDPKFPGDPADRLIYASAVDAGAPLITRDRALREFDPRGTLW